MYEESCPACVALGLAAVQAGCGCETHPGAKAKYWSRGNVTSSATFKNHFGQIKDYAAKKYQVRHSIAFTAGEVRDIRNNLLSSNSMSDLMIWTIIIVGIKLFGRIEEVLELKVEDLRTDLFVVTEEDVEALVAELDGKCDAEVQNMVMWDDKDCTDFSPVRALLIWLAKSGIKSGYIFPSIDQLKAKLESPTDHFPYGSMLNCMKLLVQRVLGKDLTSEEMINLIFGTHMLRKTGYGFAEWGWRRQNRYADQVEMAEIAMSARHKDLSSMLSYVGDNGTLFELFSRCDPNDQHQKVGTWIPIHLDALDRWKTVNKKNLKNNRPISELAEWYVFTKAGCLRERMSIRETCDICCAFQPQATADAQLTAILTTKLADDPETLKLVLGLLQQDRCDRDRTHLRNQVIVESPTATAATTTTEEAPATAEQPSRKRQRVEETPVPTTVHVAPLTAATSIASSDAESAAAEVQVQAAVADRQVEQEPYFDRNYMTEMTAIGKHKMTSNGQKWKEKVALCQAVVDRVVDNECKGRLFTAKNTGKHKKFTYNCIGVVYCLHKCHNGNVDSLMKASGKDVIDISRHSCPNACPNATDKEKEKAHSFKDDKIQIRELASIAMEE